MNLLYHIGVSGGKDSTALLLWAIHRSGLPRESLRVTFCDTGNEDVLTYEHIDSLRRNVVEKSGVVDGLVTLKPERSFYELAFWKHRFPSRKAQFCTQALKIDPTRAWLRARWSDGFDTVVLNGKRRDESKERRKALNGKSARAFSDFWGCEEWMPLLDWSVADILQIHHDYDIPLNPLYAMGCTRVGCFPCINCGKTEIRIAAKHRPEKIDQIEAAENRFEKHYGRPSTFFASKVATMPYRTKSFVDDEGKNHLVAPIRKVVEWAHTERGGEQRRLPIEEMKPCFLNYRACE